MISQKQIRNLELYIRGFADGEQVNCAVCVTDDLRSRLQKAGFTPELTAGEIVLPTALEPISCFNAEGRSYPLRDQPKETAYRTVEWTRIEFHDKDRVEVTELRDTPYQRNL